MKINSNGLVCRDLLFPIYLLTNIVLEFIFNVGKNIPYMEHLVYLQVTPVGLRGNDHSERGLIIVPSKKEDPS